MHHNGHSARPTPCKTAAIGDMNEPTDTKKREEVEKVLPRPSEPHNIAPCILLFPVGDMLIQITKPYGCTGESETMPAPSFWRAAEFAPPLRTLGTRLRARVDLRHAVP